MYQPALTTSTARQNSPLKTRYPEPRGLELPILLASSFRFRKIAHLQSRSGLAYCTTTLGNNRPHGNIFSIGTHGWIVMLQLYNSSQCPPSKEGKNRDWWGGNDGFWNGFKSWIEPDVRRLLNYVVCELWAKINIYSRNLQSYSEPFHLSYQS